MNKTMLTCLFLGLSFFSCSFNYNLDSRQSGKPNLIMENVEYIRINNGNPEIRITAEEIRRFESMFIMEMDNFSFEQFVSAPEGQKSIPDLNSRGRAGQAQLETDTNNFFMDAGVIINIFSEDINIETEKISWHDRERVLNAPGTTLITRSDGTTLTGTGFSADARKRSWEFEYAVEGTAPEK